MGDRTVHASYPGMQIVRYNRAGKWYLEPTQLSLGRQAITIAEAVETAIWGEGHGGTIHFGRPGGARFDAMVRSAP